MVGCRGTVRILIQRPDQHQAAVGGEKGKQKESIRWLDIDDRSRYNRKEIVVDKNERNE